MDAFCKNACWDEFPNPKIAQVRLRVLGRLLHFHLRHHGSILIILLHIAVRFIENVLILDPVFSHNDVPEISADFLSAGRRVLPAGEADDLHDTVNIIYDALDDNGRFFISDALEEFG